MTDWLKVNAWSLVIASLGIVFTYAATTTRFEYRISDAEEQIADNEAKIEQLTASTLATQIQLAKISSDLEYIKTQINRIIP